MRAIKRMYSIFCFPNFRFFPTRRNKSVCYFCTFAGFLLTGLRWNVYMPYQAISMPKKLNHQIVDCVDAASSGKLPVVKPDCKRNSGLTKGLRVTCQNGMIHSLPCTSSGVWIASLSTGLPINWKSNIHTHLSYLYMGLTPFRLSIFYDFIVTNKLKFVNSNYKKDGKIQAFRFCTKTKQMQAVRRLAKWAGRV